MCMFCFESSKLTKTRTVTSVTNNSGSMEIYSLAIDCWLEVERGERVAEIEE
jgi:hypothetical protein